MEQMKERYAKLLLGEDMSGGGKGVSSALALSNAITNLAGKFYVFFFFPYPFRKMLENGMICYFLICYKMI